MTITEWNNFHRFCYINKNTNLIMIAKCLDIMIINIRSCLITDTNSLINLRKM